MDVRYVNPFLSAAIKVLGTMAGLEIKAEKPFLKKGASALGDVSGIIGLSGEASGSLSVSFTLGIIKAVMKNMLGDEITEIDDEVRDAVGELTNMISGSARQALEGEGLVVKAGIPTMVSGPDHTISHRAQGPILVIPFTSEYGKVVVEVAME